MNDKHDQLLKLNEQLTRKLEKLEQHVQSQDEITKAVLETLKRGEELFELRTSRVLLNIFKSLAHNLEHVIEATQEKLHAESQGFEIKVVDGVNVKETDRTIVVRKTETGYDFSAASDPDVVCNENTTAFVNYFNANPDVFGDRTEILVNITVFVKQAPVE